MSDLAESAFLQVKAQFAGQTGIDVGKMLHAPSVRVNGKAFVFATRDVLVMKLPAERIDALELDGSGPAHDDGHTQHEGMDRDPR